MKLRVSEVFSSIQGEGYYLGSPSVFVRLFGCNFTCSGFGRPQLRGESQLVFADDMAWFPATTPPEDAKTVADLDGNAFTVGCDTRYSWDPAYKHLSEQHSPASLACAVAVQLNRGPDHVVFTGGEPLLHQVALMETIKLIGSRLTHITFETNGSIALEKETIVDLWEWLKADAARTVLFSNSPKLAHSGEPEEKRINTKAAMSQALLRSRAPHRGSSVVQTYKYVVHGTDEDFLEAKQMHRAITGLLDETKHSWRKVTQLYPAYAMPLGATFEQYAAIRRDVADMCMKHALTYTPRAHLDLYGNAIGT